MAQINAVENPIINSPYDEPRAHWRIETGKQPDLYEEDTKGEEYLLDLANLLRQRVREWRERDYSGATRITRELIALWRAPDRAQPLFYAQLEAAETVIFLVEGPTDLRQ